MSDSTMPQHRVLGFGGLFFRSADSKSLALWYRDNLGIDLVPDDYGKDPWHQSEGPTVFAPFVDDTTYFGEDMSKRFMLNFRVSDLDAMVAQLRANGNEVTVDADDYPNGRFARVYDPEGNPVELWEPKPRVD